MRNVKYTNAGAGSGKTYTLTHQLADHLSGNNVPKISPSEVIVTTFTKAAAAEIVTRARQVLIENDMVKEAAQLDSAAIGTVHSVAQKFLNKYWYAIHSTPNQEVLSSADKKSYRNRSISQLLDNSDYSAERKAINAYTEEFSPKGALNADNPNFWMDDLEGIISKITYYDMQPSEVKASIEQSKASVRSFFSNKDITQDQNPYTALRNAYIEEANAAYRTKQTDTNYKEFIKRQKISTTCTYANLLNLYEWATGIGFDQDKLDKAKIILTCSHYGDIICNCIDAIFNLAQAWMADYSAFKRANSIIDYDDMEKGLLEILNNEGVAKEIGKSFKLVMVDEFQDSNSMQIKIFDRLSEIISDNDSNAQSSWVGDPNQAIYGFRGTDSKLINHVVKDVEKNPPLKNSYRSRKSLVDTFNKVFAQKGLFSEMTELSAVRKDKEGMQKSVQRWYFQDKSEKDYTDNIARHIKAIVESRKYQVEDKDSKQLRDLEYNDIAILCRRNTEINTIAKSLRAESIPVYAPEKDIIDNAEVQLLLSLLELAANRDNKHEIASVLHLLYDWSTEEILTSRLDSVKKNTDWMPKGCPELATVDTVIKDIRKNKDLTISEKLTMFILELGLNDKMNKWGATEVRCQNMSTLVNTSKNFESYCKRFNVEAYSILEFRKYLNNLDEFDVSKETSSKSVKVYTYHGSKGLEWPMVILYSLDYSDYNEENFMVREYFGLHEIQGTAKEGEIIPSYTIHYFPTPISKAHALFSNSSIKDTTLYKDSLNRLKDEMKRLLYVGATRARDYLVLLDSAFYYNDTKGGLNRLSEIGLTTADFDSIDISIAAITPDKPENVGRAPGMNADQATIDAYNERNRKMEEYKQVLEDIKAYRARRAAPKLYTLRDIADIEDQKFDPRYINPSKLGKSDASKAVEPKMLTVRELPENSIFAKIDEGENNSESISGKAPMNKVGTCIHNIYAACPSKGTEPTAEEREQFISIAKQIITNFNLNTVLTSPEEIVDSLYALYAWLTDRYGTATAILHEYPFNFPLNDEQVIKGEIDLIWQTAEGDVVVDFKNIDGTADELLTPGSKHYVGNHYIPQLLAYKDRLVSAGHTVIDCVLYYNIGKAVIFK